MNKALFLDRDGVVNIDRDYVIRREDFQFQDGFIDFCQWFLSKDFKIIIISNQSGVSRGYFSENDLQELHKYMLGELRQQHITITDIFYCTSVDDSHPDRKPNSGMFLKAKDKHSIDMVSSVSVGDKERDILAAKKAGVGINILLAKNKNTATSADYTVANLQEITQLCIL